MIAFAAAAAGLVAATLVLLLRPWWPGADPSSTPDARTLRRRLYLQQREEWARQRAAGLLDAPADGTEETDTANATDAAMDAELQRRLLDDLDAPAGGDAPTASSPRGRDRTPWGLALAVPVVAAAGYAWLGHPEAIDASRGPAVMPVSAAPAAAAASMSAPDGPMTAATVVARVEALADRLREHPDDPAGWTRLARSWRVLGRASDAQHAYERIGPSMQDDATLLAEYADARAAQRGGRLDEPAARALRRALEVDPRNPTALSLAATAAWNAHDVAEARRRWEQLLAVLPPGSTDAARVQAWLARLPRLPASGAGPAPRAASR